jgi:pyridoxamine 5'-phosphate oxidase
MLHKIRKNYQLSELTEQSASFDPFIQFENWLNDALSADEPEPTAMVISTVDNDMQPHSRVVLLKEFTPEGLVFYTNYLGNKGQQLENNPGISALFFWASMERQVRITGKAEKIPTEQSDEYFQSRPIESQLGAWVSEQSTVIPSPKYLTKRFEVFKQQFGDKIPRPTHWGGYLIRPDSFEFWQGRPNRLHDRLHYVVDTSGKWKRYRLAP